MTGKAKTGTETSAPKGYFKCLICFTEEWNTHVYLPRIPIRGDHIWLDHIFPVPEETSFGVQGVILFPHNHPATKNGYAALVAVKALTDDEEVPNTTTFSMDGDAPYTPKPKGDNLK